MPKSVSIPQAVSTVATYKDEVFEYQQGGFNTASGKYCCNRSNKKSILDIINVSIPQAVSTVATKLMDQYCVEAVVKGFNTASGKYCCNATPSNLKVIIAGVSIPQAVSTVATYLAFLNKRRYIRVSIPQAVSTVATNTDCVNP